MVTSTRGTVIVLAAAAGLGACTEVPRSYSTRSARGQEIFRDAFDRDEIGDAWRATGPGAWIENGVLKQQGLRNHPLWLAQPLPDDIRIDLDVWAATEEGDIKLELCGDGQAFAKTENYVATGYVVIMGGWNNSLSAIVRRNEHGKDRVTTGDTKTRPDKRYHITVTRIGGELRWEVDGEEILAYEDPRPLRGEAHNFFALSGWEAETHFDNLVIEAL